MRSTIATIGVKHNRNFRDLLTAYARLDDHFTGEFHPMCYQPQLCTRRFRKSPQATMSIPDRTPKEEIKNASQDRIAHIAMQPGHRPGANTPPEPIAHHKVVSPSQSVNKRTEFREVIGIVRVAHNDVSSLERRECPRATHGHNHV